MSVGDKVARYTGRHTSWFDENKHYNIYTPLRLVVYRYGFGDERVSEVRATVVCTYYREFLVVF